MTGATVWEYDTHVWTQRLLEAEGGWVLRRSVLGEARGHLARRASTAAAAELSHDSSPVDPPDDSAAFVASAVSADISETGLSAPLQAAAQLWPAPTDAWRGVHGEAAMHRAGRLLVALHGLDHDLVDTGSPHLLRLMSHLDAAGDSPSAQIVGRMPAGIIEEICGWLTAIPRRGVLCHGGWSLGSVFTTDDLAVVEVPVGDELTASIPELDLGWMVGELTEYEYLSTLRGVDGSIYARLASALIDTYRVSAAHPVSDLWVQRVAALRFTLHQFDFAATVGDADSVAAHLPFACWLVERAQSDPKGRS